MTTNIRNIRRANVSYVTLWTHGLFARVGSVAPDHCGGDFYWETEATRRLSPRTRLAARPACFTHSKRRLLQAI